MIIIAESGATKTAWRAICVDGQVRSVQTGGMSPTCLDAEHLQSVLRQSIPALNPEGSGVTAVYFYGAGLVSEEAAAPIREALEIWCPFAEIHFHSDLMAAARALFGDGDGIVAIMGTGSNSCLYAGGSIVSNIRPGGFILGDEGSGASLGKMLISDYIKGMLPEAVEQELISRYPLTYQQIVHKVYKESGAGAYLASFAPFVLEHADEPTGYLRSIIEDSIDSFIRRSLCRYPSSSDGVRRVGVVGSFGCACEEYLRKAGCFHGIEFVKFIKSPIEELVRYHGI